MDIKEAYKVMQEASGIEVGDTVKVLRGYKTDEMGSVALGCTLTGVIGTVRNMNKYHVLVSTNGVCISHPFFVLKVTEKVKKANMITVKGKEYSEDTLDKAMKEYINK